MWTGCEGCSDGHGRSLGTKPLNDEILANLVKQFKTAGNRRVLSAH